MTAALVLLAAFAASALLTGMVRRYALARSVLDIPNDRSAHVVPTPRGGGLAIATVLLGGLAVAGFVGAVARDFAVAVVGGGILVALVGWIDDHRPLSARWRALAHFAAAAWAVLWLHGLPRLRFGLVDVPLGIAGTVLAVVGIVWAVNLYNFMDGIDGIAGGEAVSAGGAGALLLLAVGDRGLALAAGLVVAASAGFLVWNWAPAKIFMGDVGSGLLGFVFGTLAVESENFGALPLAAWVLLLGVFVLDATVTLARRVMRGESWHAAHSQHAYQRAARAGRRHARVSGAVLVINLVLAGLAWAAVLHPPLLIPAFLLGTALVGGIYAHVERTAPLPPRGG